MKFIGRFWPTTNIPFGSLNELHFQFLDFLDYWLKKSVTLSPKSWHAMVDP